MAFSGVGGIVDWVSFNPQPDPPGDVFSYEITFAGDATLALGVTENGNPLTFSAAPEPGTWVMMALGFASLGALPGERGQDSLTTQQGSVRERELGAAGAELSAGRMRVLYTVDPQHRQRLQAG